jgi:hypothetical protein
MRNAGAELALPRGTITREAQRGNNLEKLTIDLVFATETLQNQIIHCRVAEELEQSSDHLPIATTFQLSNAVKTQEINPRRAWKKLDEKLFLETLQREAEPLRRLPLNSRLERLCGCPNTCAELYERYSSVRVCRFNTLGQAQNLGTGET